MMIHEVCSWRKRFQEEIIASSGADAHRTNRQHLRLLLGFFLNEVPIRRNRKEHVFFKFKVLPPLHFPGLFIPLNFESAGIQSPGPRRANKLVF